MLFMVEVRYRRETRDEAFNYFEQHGVSGYQAGLTVEALWVASSDFLAYAVVRADDHAAVEHVIQDLKPLAEVQIRPIVGMDEF